MSFKRKQQNKVKHKMQPNYKHQWKPPNSNPISAISAISPCSLMPHQIPSISIKTAKFLILTLFTLSSIPTFQSSSINQYLEQKAQLQQNNKALNLVAQQQPKRFTNADSIHKETPFYSISATNINHRAFLSGFASDTKKIKKPFNTSRIVVGSSVTICKEPNRKWDTLKITATSIHGTPKCNNNVCAYFARSLAPNVVITKHMQESLKNRAVFNQRHGQFILQNILVQDEASYKCAFSYITSHNVDQFMNVSVMAPPDNSILSTSVLIDKSVILGSKKSSLIAAKSGFSGSYDSITGTYSGNSGKTPSSTSMNILVCQAAKSRPPAKVYWRWENPFSRPLDWFEQREEKPVSEYGSLVTTTNTLIFTPDKKYNRQSVRCVVEHPGIPGSRWTQTRKLSIQYRPVIKGFKRVGTHEILCKVDSNPPAEVTWSFIRQNDLRMAYSSKFSVKTNSRSRLSSLYNPSRVSGNRLNLYDNRLTANDTITCEASNVHGKVSKSINVGTIISGYGLAKVWGILKYVLAIVLLIACFSFVILQYSKRQRRLKDDDKNGQHMGPNGDFLKNGGNSGNSKNSKGGSSTTNKRGELNVPLLAGQNLGQKPISTNFASLPRNAGNAVDRTQFYNEYCTLPSQRGVAHGHQIQPPNINNISNNTSGSKQSTTNQAPSNSKAFQTLQNAANLPKFSQNRSHDLNQQHFSQQHLSQKPVQHNDTNLSKAQFIDETQQDFQEFTIDDNGIPDSGTHNSMSSCETARSLELEQLFHSPKGKNDLSVQSSKKSSMERGDASPVRRKMLVEAESELTRDIKELRSKFDAISRGEKIREESFNLY